MEVGSMTDSEPPVTPVDVEKAVCVVKERIEAAPRVIRGHRADYMKAKRDYAVAYAIAYQDAEGTQVAKKMDAELATQAQREALDDSYIRYQYSKEQLQALKEELRGLQTIGASMRQAYWAAGTGER